MNAKEVSQFKELFAQYCREMESSSSCIPDTCDICPINAAYKKIFCDSACTNVPEVTGLPNIIKAQFISVWDDGTYVFATDCMVDCGSRKVYNIEECTDDNVGNAEHLDREYIRLPNGQEFDVVSEDDMEDDYNGFYYTR